MTDLPPTKPSSSKSRSGKQHKEIRFGAYVLGSTLGEGEFGKVKLGWKKESATPSQVAIKFIRRSSIPRGSERETKVHREINALKRLSHPNIIRLEEVLQNEKYIGIVLEYASGGELFDYILKQRYLKDSFACKLFAQMVSGVHYMHSKGIVHRDLKLENLLLDKNKNIVITDFGFVNSFNESSELMKTSCGSPCYAAPELVISNEPYLARKVDVWSCGVILYAMLAGYLPFDDDPKNPDGDDIVRLYNYITTTNLTFPEYVEPMPRDLLRRILVPDPKRRISLREIRNHQWLTPYAPYLSVTPEEWDDSLKSKKLTKTGVEHKNENKRHSLIETTGSAKGLPLPPQTSSNFAVALPSSASSTTISDYVRANTSHKGHKRTSSVQSVSSASIALQAVVDANTKAQDKTRRGSITASVSPQLHQQTIPRSTTHTGISSFVTAASPSSNVIVEESPIKPLPVIPSSKLSLSTSPGGGFAVPKIPIEATSQVSPKQSQPHASKLPGPGSRKPRPTSYHPSLYTSHEYNGSNVLNSAPAFEFPRTSFARSDSRTSVSSMANGKFSMPLVDLSSAEGDIIVPRSPILITEAFENFTIQDKAERDESKSLEIKSPLSSSCNDQEGLSSVPPPTPPSQLYVPSVDEPTAGISRSESYRSKKTNRYSALLGADIVFDKLFGSSSSEKPDISRSASRHSSIRSTSSKPSTLTKHTTMSESSRNPSTSSKTPRSISQSNKSKRFSFLGFYSSTPDDEPILPIASKPVLPASAPIEGQTKRVLESTTRGNIQLHSAPLRKEPSIIEYTSFQPRKEPSTAKKVFDYLKRRSMRSG